MFSWLRAPSHQHLFDTLSQNGGEGRFVGSAVRDSLLGRAPQDYDMATTHTPDISTELLEGAGFQVIPTGLAHGTVTALWQGQRYEITSLRQDVQTDGRHARVLFTQEWELDAARRDFTMNALYLDRAGRIFDYHGGNEDLQAGRVRFIGDPEARIREDYLRILRFFRFSTWYGKGPLDPAGLAACVALQDGLERLARERITHEFLRLLEASDPWPVLYEMGRCGFLAFILGTTLTNTSLWQAFEPFEKALAQPIDPLLRLKVLISDPSHLCLTRLQKRIWRGKDAFSPLLENLDTLSLDAALQQHHTIQERAQKAKDFPLTGHDLIQAGIPPGPTLGAYLAELRTWWKEAGYPDREACLSYVMDCRAHGVRVP